MEQSQLLIVTAAVLVAGAAFYFFVGGKRKFLDATKKQTVTLVEKEHLSHDVRRFRFALPGKNFVLGLPVGKYLFISAEIDGKTVSRPYTPVSSDDDVGYFDCVVKVYFPPRGGVMTQYLESLKIGDTVEVRGPIGRIEYTGNGSFLHTSTTAAPQIFKTKHIGMICGGTGITPMLQVMRDILKTAGDDTKISMLFANQTEEDILLRNELDAEQAKYPDQVKIWYTVDRAPESGWDYSTGFISEQMIRDHMPTGPEAFYLLCGPPPMIKFACLPNLEKVGVKESKILTF